MSTKKNYFLPMISYLKHFTCKYICCRHEILINTETTTVTVSHMAQSFDIGKPVRSETMAVMLQMLKKQLRGTKRKILSTYNTISRAQVSTMNITLSINQPFCTIEFTNFFYAHVTKQAGINMHGQP